MAVMRRRYMNGASTNPDAHVVAYAAAQVKKGLDIAKKLGAENFGNYMHWSCSVAARIMYNEEYVVR